MHNALITAGRLKAGESVLIQGASSGVGLMGLQIAKLKGAQPVIGIVDQRHAPRPAQGVRRRPRHRHARPDMARGGAQGHRRQGRQPDRRHGVRQHGQPGHARDRAAWPHRQRRPARRQQGRVRLRPACAQAHRLYRRHLPHPHDRRGARDRAQDVGRPQGRGRAPASSASRSTAPSSSTTPLRRRPTCAPTRISARSC